MSRQQEMDAAAETLGPTVIDATGIFSDWRNKLIQNNERKPRALLANVVTTFRHAPEWKRVLAHDRFADEIMLVKAPPFIEDSTDWMPRAWTDADDIRATDWMQRQGILVKDRDVALAAQMVARENGYHPVKDWLDGLQWDGESRIEDLLPRIFGAAASPYHQAVFRCFLIGSVARIYMPGCKMDTMLVLEGPQGARKSTAVRELWGEPYVTDDMPDLGTKDAQITVGSAWCIELAEISALVGRRKEVEVIKAFISRREDNFRPPYGRRNVRRPRHSVLVGTTNASDDWMRDETGGRRFWPLRCGEIDLELLRANREQLWAEAVALYRLGPDEGGAWWFTDKTTQKEAREEQDARTATDPWEPLVLEFVSTKLQTTGEDILVQCLKKISADLEQRDLMRVTRFLRRAGWTKKEGSIAGRPRGWIWYPPASSEEVPN
jgi:predicted P-loop ATPase